MSLIALADPRQRPSLCRTVASCFLGHCVAASTLMATAYFSTGLLKVIYGKPTALGVTGLPGILLEAIAAMAVGPLFGFTFGALLIAHTLIYSIPLVLLFTNILHASKVATLLIGATCGVVVGFIETKVPFVSLSHQEPTSIVLDAIAFAFAGSSFGFTVWKVCFDRITNWYLFG